jgi:hypothetical protein
MSLDNAILHEALELGPAERAELARRLLLSLETTELDCDVDQAWVQEIEERIDRAESTKQPLSDWRSAIERVRNSLNHPNE